MQFESKEEKGWDDLFKQNKNNKNKNNKTNKAKNLLKNLVTYGAESGGSWNKKGLTRILSSLCEEQRLMIGEQWSRNEEKMNDGCQCWSRDVQAVSS